MNWHESFIRKKRGAGNEDNNDGGGGGGIAAGRVAGRAKIKITKPELCFNVVCWKGLRWSPCQHLVLKLKSCSTFLHHDEGVGSLGCHSD